MDKENAIVDSGSSQAASRKSRSKSMGPGGLDALKQSTGNRRASLAAPVKLPRSILKSSISSLPDIPPLKKGSQKTSAASETCDPAPGSSLSTEDLLGSKLPLRTEEEQQAAAREREDSDRRDARRKSLANRRVSFAAEATLHTFHEIEYMHDSTTSTDSTRRASSAGGGSPKRDSTVGGRPETPQSQAENIPRSPENRWDQQRRQRRNSGIPPMSFGNTDDYTLASTVYSSDSEPADAVEDIAEDEEASSSDSDDGTLMTIDAEEVTGFSVASYRSTATAEDATLDEALRIAAQRAGAHNQDDDSDDGEEVIIPSFGWVKKGNRSSEPASVESPLKRQAESQQEEQGDGTEMDMEIDADMDMTHAVGRILTIASARGTDLCGDMSMDVTRALGGILPQDRADGAPNDQEEEATDEATMEFTTPMGGIHGTLNQDPDDVEDNEEMSMELTTIIGGVLSKPRDKCTAASRRQSPNRQAKVEAKVEVDDAAIDMTVSVGRIVSAASPKSKDETDATMGMDMTTAIGGIMEMSSRTLNKRIMEEEADGPDSPIRAIVAAVTKQSPSRRSSRISQMTPCRSPGISAFQGKGLRRSLGPPTQTTPRSGSPSRTPSPCKPTTPSRRPASASRGETGHQSPRPQPASPEKPSPANKTPSPTKATPQRVSFFQHNPETGNKTPTVVLTPPKPTVVLTPPKRRLSGVGIDRPGLGSPVVAALCDRRRSIGELASVFVPGERAVAFLEPKEMEKEVDRERQDEEDKENRRKILQGEADGPREDRDVTFNLREMINNLSPKWKPVRGRKSLHVGSAKGLLGKRPAELEGDEEAEDNDGVKRLKGYQSSPVKKVGLQQPWSKSETTGRFTRSARKSLEQAVSISMPPFSSPLKGQPATTPQKQGRFERVEDSPGLRGVNFDDLTVKDEAGLEREVDEEKIHLQDFLNMTSIRFMELTTTKRRHTMAPATREDGSADDGQDGISLERCVVAGACTVPMLELYQHSCRELKQYISEGRHMVKEIEKETFEENPRLFGEYTSAPPNVKALMDNQFKNVKTQARLLSKAMWYEWRMKLQDGLKEGLVKIAEGMQRDSKLLQGQQDLLASVLPAVVARHDSLQEEDDNLQQAAREMADCDPAELELARQELEVLEEDVATKRQHIAELKGQLEISAAEVEELSLKKTKCLAEMEEWEAMREKYRGWTSREVNALKARVEAIEKELGWAVSGLSGSRLSMTYKRDIELVVDIGSDGPRTPLDLWHIGDAGEAERSPEKEMLLQCLRHHARGLQQSGAKTADVVGSVQAGWDKALLVSSHISRIRVAFPTTVSRTCDWGISATSSLLLVPLRTKVEVTLLLDSCSGTEVSISAAARVVYGEHFNVGKIEDFVLGRMGKTVDGDKGEDWSEVLVELRRRLIARGKK